MWTTAKRTSVFVVYGLELCSATLALAMIKILSSKLGVSHRFRQTISVFNCLTGGVFFATSIMHLLPEAREKLTEVFEDLDVKSEYPITEGLAGVGFLLILLLETTARKCCSKGNCCGYGPHRKGNVYSRSSVAYRPVKQDDPKAHTEETHSGIKVKDFEDSSWVDDVGYYGYGAVDTSLDGTPSCGETETSSTENNYVTKERNFHEGDKSYVSRKDILTSRKRKSSQGEDSGSSKLRGVILLLALSLHMVFDGIALGLLTKESKVWTLLLALSIHKLLVFFSLGIQAYEILKSVKKTFALIVVISFVSPLGIWIGVLLTTGSDVSQDVAAGVLQGIATGTFLYVTFFEILHKELNERKATLLRVFVTVVGFAAVAAVRLLEDEDEPPCENCEIVPTVSVTMTTKL